MCSLGAHGGSYVRARVVIVLLENMSEGGRGSRGLQCVALRRTGGPVCGAHECRGKGVSGSSMCSLGEHGGSWEGVGLQDRHRVGKGLCCSAGHRNSAAYHAHMTF